MLRLAGINLIGAVVFCSIYAAAAGRWLAHGAFLASLIVSFGALTAIWLRVEGARGGDIVSRIGTAAAALVALVVGLPVVVLAPLFALQEILPPEAGFHDVTRPAMVLLLISLGLVVAVNAAGVCARAGWAIWARLARRPRSGR